MTTSDEFSFSTVTAASHDPEPLYGSAIVSRARSLLFMMPERIEQYRILERIGGGGMGEVYAAEQDPPVQRKVALKVIKAGMDTFHVLARFDAERQALARMNHANIAAVYDAGVTDAGRPYFVMEWISGIPITRYCDQKQLSIRQRLELMMTVCQAIQHAHQKGIIHRDIKPHNVLVGSDDGIPKVIDFGIAKAIGTPLVDQLTLTGSFGPVGTPPYMSPEQLDGSGQETDTRTDVYGLGALLYELLVGVMPVDPVNLPNRDQDQFIRAIRDFISLKPSARLRTLGEPLTTIAADRSSTAAQLQHLVGGELDSIVMKALEKEPSRRYESVAALADDLNRFLRGERIMAGSGSSVYRLRKFASRHKLAIAFTGVIAASLLLGATTTTIELVRENHQRKLAEAGRADAEAQRRNAQATIDFLDQDLLAKATPESVPDKATRDVLVHNLIEPAIQTVDDRLKNQPLARAAVRETLAEVLWSLGRYDLSLTQARAAFNLRNALLGPDDLSTGRSIHSVAWALLRLGNVPEAGTMLKQWLDRRQQIDRPDSRTILDAMEDYASFLMACGKAGEAAPIYAHVYDRTRRTIGDDNLLTIQQLRNYSAALSHSGHADQAEPLAKRAVDDARRVVGPRSPITLQAMEEYAHVLTSLNRFAQAATLRKQLLDLEVGVFGPDHPDTLLGESEYAMAVADLGKLAEAKPLAKTAYEHARRVLGASSRTTLNAMNNFVTVLTMLDQNAEAVSPAQEVFQRLRTAFGNEDADAIYAESNYAIVLYGLNQPDEAAPLLRHVWEHDRRTLGDTNADTVAIRNSLALALRAGGHTAEAAAITGGSATRPAP